MRVVNSLVVRDGNVLLMFKASRQKWFMPGGKAEFGENVIETGCRECFEEAGVQIQDARLGAVTTVVIDELHEEWVLYTIVGNQITGEVVEECREGILRWHPIASINELPMFEGDRFIVQELLKEKSVNPVVSTQFYTPSYELKKLVVASKPME